MIDGTTLESMPELEGQMSIEDFFLQHSQSIREATDLEVAAFFDSTAR